MTFKLFVFAALVAYAAAGKYDQTAEAQLQRGSVSLKQSCNPTAKDILGPYYKPNAPLQPAASGYTPICTNTPANDRLFLNGTVRLGMGSGDCGKPVKALFDIWHADAGGVYSNTSPSSKDFGCRIKVYTDSNGFYRLSSIFPGRYDDGGYRPAHVHFKITPVDSNNTPIGRSLTTQLYFYNDYYLAPRDSCNACGSGQPSLVSHVQHNYDIKSFEGSWDVLLNP